MDRRHQRRLGHIDAPDKRLLQRPVNGTLGNNGRIGIDRIVIAGIDQIIPIEETVDQAVGALTAA